MGIHWKELQSSKVSQTDAEEFVRQVIDIHVHGPDGIPRKYNPDASSLLKETGKILGVVLKSHLHTDMITVANQVSSDSKGKLSVFGSRTLNNGFRSEEVRKAIHEADSKPFIIWGPTVAAKAYLNSIAEDYAIPKSWVKGSAFSSIPKDAFTPVTCLDESGNITSECIEVLELLKGTSGVLASGHLGGDETYKIGIEARKQGIPFIATHVLLGERSPLIDQQLEELIHVGAWLEFCYIFIKDEDWHMKYNRGKIVQQIKKFLSHVVVSSDCGQVKNPSPSVCMAQCVRLLSAHGLSKEELHTIMVDNPKKVLGL